jgi:hypothetical protein
MVKPHRTIMNTQYPVTKWAAIKSYVLYTTSYSGSYEIFVKTKPLISDEIIHKMFTMKITSK